MTPLDVPIRFERDMGCTIAELLASLEKALPQAAVRIDTGHAQASATFEDGMLHLAWGELPPRRIALLVLPRTQVRFHYESMSALRRHEVQRRFDMVYQRGGG